MTTFNRQAQIDEIYQLIMQLASGNLMHRAPVTGADDELDAITVGINMLAEELQATTVSKNYLSRIYKGVVDMLIVLNADFTIREVNSTTVKVLGYNEDELLGLDFRSLFSRNESRFVNKLQRELEKKGFMHDEERVFRTKRGRNVSVSLSCSLLPEGEGDDSQSGVLFIAKDISRIKRTEEELRAKNDELNTFIYRASHDLKGPLASILGLVDLAKDEVEDVDSIRDYLELIHVSARRLDTILNDFLELGRLTQSHVRPSNVQFDTLIQEILRSLQYLPDLDRIKFEISVRQVHPFRSKKILLKAILQNLIDNAIKYTPADAENPVVGVEVEEEEKTGDIIIRVSDNGIGIEKAFHDKIFAMFFRGNEMVQGTGLGLYIVKSSVDALRGQISVRSKLGQGTTFTIRLPKKQ